jgi:hypothetical protein
MPSLNQEAVVRMGICEGTRCKSAAGNSADTSHLLGGGFLTAVTGLQLEAATLHTQ